MSSTDTLSIRDCCHGLIAAIDEHGEGDNLEAEIKNVMTGLLERPDLLVLGVDRAANHAPWSSYLYYDGELALHVNYLPKGRALPVHDHGIWEAVALYRGKVRHTTYTRTDDFRKAGHADLQVIDDRTMGLGELQVVTPPDDIHSLEALADDTYIVTVQLNKFKPDRMYFQPDQGTYLIRNQTSWRASL